MQLQDLSRIITANSSGPYKINLRVDFYISSFLLSCQVTISLIYHSFLPSTYSFQPSTQSVPSNPLIFGKGGPIASLQFQPFFFYDHIMIYFASFFSLSLLTYHYFQIEVFFQNLILLKCRVNQDTLRMIMNGPILKRSPQSISGRKQYLEKVISFLVRK